MSVTIIFSTMLKASCKYIKYHYSNFYLCVKILYIILTACSQSEILFWDFSYFTSDGTIAYICVLTKTSYIIGNRCTFILKMNSFLFAKIQLRQNRSSKRKGLYSCNHKIFDIPCFANVNILGFNQFDKQCITLHFAVK